MPSIECSKKDLESLSRVTFNSRKVLEDALWLAKTELEDLDGDVIKASVSDGNRPDLLSVEGLAREIRHRLGVEKGIPKYVFKKSGRNVVIDAGLANIRPAGAFAFAKNVDVSEELLVQLVQFQEKICLTYGRRRRDVSMGIYDADQVKGTVFFKAVDPKTKFIPLDYRVEMTLEEILAEHPKGKEYAGLLAGAKKYPILVDEQNNILSMPPVINSAKSGKVLPGRRNLFLDITGHDETKVNNALTILCMLLADRGATIESVTVVKENVKPVETPMLFNQKLTFAKSAVSQITGTKLTDRQILDLLAKAGYNAKIAGAKITVEYPSWRVDILHPVDVIEDILIGYGYSNVKPEPILLATAGRESLLTKTIDGLVESLTGLGLTQVLTYYLTSPKNCKSR